MKITWNEDVKVLEGHINPLNGHWERPDLAPGTAAWVRRLGGPEDGAICAIDYVCPCGCSGVYQLPVATQQGPGVWQWDGNQAEPTITPSIDLLSVDHLPNHKRWHGFLRKGEFVLA